MRALGGWDVGLIYYSYEESDYNYPGYREILTTSSHREA